MSFPPILIRYKLITAWRIVYGWCWFFIHNDVYVNNYLAWSGSPEVIKMWCTHWGRVTHICVSNLTINVSDNGLSSGRRQAIIQTNAGILSIGLLATNFNEISIGIQTFSFKKMHFKMSSVKWRPFCLGLNVLITSNQTSISYSNTFYGIDINNHWMLS